MKRHPPPPPLAGSSDGTVAATVGGSVGAGAGVFVGGTGVLVGGTGVSVGGTGVSVGGTGVFVGGTGVLVGGTGVFVGGTGVLVGGTGVFVGGTGVLVGGTGVSVGTGVLVGGTGVSVGGGTGVSVGTGVAVAANSGKDTWKFTKSFPGTNTPVVEATSAFEGFCGSPLSITKKRTWALSYSSDFGSTVKKYSPLITGTEPVLKSSPTMAYTSYPSGMVPETDLTEPEKNAGETITAVGSGVLVGGTGVFVATGIDAKSRSMVLFCGKLKSRTTSPVSESMYAKKLVLLAIT